MVLMRFAERQSCGQDRRRGDPLSKRGTRPPLRQPERQWASASDFEPYKAIGRQKRPTSEQNTLRASDRARPPCPKVSLRLYCISPSRPIKTIFSRLGFDWLTLCIRASLPLLGLDTIESMADLPPVRRTSGRTGSYDGTRYLLSTTVEFIFTHLRLLCIARLFAIDGQTASETLTTDDEDEVEIIVDSSMRQDGDKSSKSSSERKGSTTIGDSQSRVPRSLDGGVVGFGMGTPSTPPSEHQGNGVACRFYNRERCIKGSACPWSHAPDTYSLRSRPE